MKFFAIPHCVALATVAGTVMAGDIQPYKAETIQPYKADSIQPRNAGAVQPRYAEPVQPRYAEPVQPRQAKEVQPHFADSVQDRRAPMVANTAVQGTNPKAWSWQQIADTKVADDGLLGHGSQLANVRCAGLACRIYQSTGGGWTIEGKGGFPELAGSGLRVQLMNLDTERLQVDSRMRGIFSDGSFWDVIETYKLPAGRYAAFYLQAGKEQVSAAMTFDVKRHDVAVKGSGTGRQKQGAAQNAGANQELINQARRNALCLGAAAMNPDVRCVPAGQ